MKLDKWSSHDFSPFNPTWFAHCALARDVRRAVGDLIKKQKPGSNESISCAKQNVKAAWPFCADSVDIGSQQVSDH